MRIPSILLVSVLSAGCAHQRAPQVQIRPLAPSIESDDLRFREILGVYHVGRLVDPTFPDQMHEGHTVYRVESEAAWDLRPPLAPMSPSAPRTPVDATVKPPPYDDAIVAELNRQQAATARVMEEATQLARSYQELREVLQRMARVAEEQGALTTSLRAAETRQRHLEESLRRLVESGTDLLAAPGTRQGGMGDGTGSPSPTSTPTP